MRFCFYIFLAVAASGAAGLRAAVPQARVRTVAVAPRLVPVVRADPRSGQLVRTLVVESKVVESRVVAPQVPASETLPAAGSMEMASLVEETANAYQVSPALVESVIQVESNYNTRAISPKGAQGLMQLMPATARRFGVRNTFDAKQNIEGGVRYLRFLQDTFKDDRLAIAAYNAGEGAVQKYGNVPPYAETLDYVAKVGRKYGQARRAAEVKRKTQDQANRVPVVPEYRHLARYVDAEGRVFLTTQ